MENELGERIRARRQRKSWTLKDLAKATELSVPYLSDLERRLGVNPTLETLSAVAKALECDVADLIGDSPAVGSGPRLLPPSLNRFVRGEDFAKRVRRIAEQAGRSPEVVEVEVVDFLAVAPKRASGDLSAEDWRRLLDFYAGVILQE